MKTTMMITMITMMITNNHDNVVFVVEYKVIMCHLVMHRHTLMVII